MSHPTALASRSFVLEPCAWSDCETIADHPDHPLCGDHYRQVGMMFIHEHIDVMRAAAGAPTTAEMIERLMSEEPEHHRAKRREAADADRAARTAAGVVYYFRVGDHIKIGTTIDLQRRMHEMYVAPADLLATETGGQDVERQRHREFADEHVTRELFNPSPRLLAHIESLQ